MAAPDASSILQHLPVAVVVLDSDRRIKRLNLAAETLLGLTPAVCQDQQFDRWVETGSLHDFVDVLNHAAHRTLKAPIPGEKPPTAPLGLRKPTITAGQPNGFEIIWAEVSCSMTLAGSSTFKSALLQQTWSTLTLTPTKAPRQTMLQEQVDTSESSSNAHIEMDEKTASSSPSQVRAAPSSQLTSMFEAFANAIRAPVALLSSDGQHFFTNALTDQWMHELMEGAYEDPHLEPYIKNCQIHYRKSDTIMDSHTVFSHFQAYDIKFTQKWPESYWPISRSAIWGYTFGHFACGFEGPNGARRILEMEGGALRADNGRGERIGGFNIMKRIIKVAPKPVNGEDAPMATQVDLDSHAAAPTTKTPDLAAEMTMTYRDNPTQDFVWKVYEALCADLSDPVVIGTPDHTSHWYNHAWYKLTGATEEETRLNGWAHYIHSADLPRVGQALASANDKWEPFECSARVRNERDGLYKWTLWKCHPFKDERGDVQGWFFLGSDSDAAYQRLATNEEARENLMDAIQIADLTLWAIDLDGRFTLVEGPLGKEYLRVGNSIYECWGMSVRQYIERALQGETVAHETEVLGRTYRVQYKPRRARAAPSGSFQEEDASFTDETTQIIGVVGLTIDITERRALEERMAKSARDVAKAEAASAAAEEANKTKSQFLAMVSHEIRTPINGVVGLSELLLDVPDLPVEATELVESVLRSSNALLMVVNDVLDFSKIEAGKLDLSPASFSPRLVCEDAIRYFSKLVASKGVRLEHDVRIGSQMAFGDEGRITQILNNLLSNASKFTDSGYIKLAAYEERVTGGDNVQMRYTFAISDSGCGITEAQRQLLFRPFQQADPSTSRQYGGTGLGLAICKNLVELMKGEIRMESLSGTGTTVSFNVMLGASAAAPDGGNTAPVAEFESMRSLTDFAVSSAARSSSPQSSTPVHGARVLLAEDNPINSHIAIKNLEKLGYVVRHVENGREALELLQQDTTFDVVLMDCMMPVMDGYQATRAMRCTEATEYMQEIPVIALTAAAIDGRAICLSAGFSDFLSKPVRRATLNTTLKRWLGKSHRKTMPAPTAVQEAVRDDVRRTSSPNVQAVAT